VNLTTGWLLPAWRATFAAHVVAAAGGWFLMLVIGISYHLLTFFGFVDKRREFRWPAAVRRLLHAGVVLGIVAASLPSLGRGAGTPAEVPSACIRPWATCGRPTRTWPCAPCCWRCWHACPRQASGPRPRG